jgi:hypothetical protein
MPASQNIPADDIEQLDWSTIIPSSLVSTLFHICLVLALILIPQVKTPEQHRPPFVATLDDLPTELVDFTIDPLPSFTPANEKEREQVEAETLKLPSPMDVDVPIDGTLDTNIDTVADAPLGSETDFIFESIINSTSIGKPGSNEVGLGRIGRRPKAMQRGDITAGSEAAVANSLKWLANVQQRDGGWSFDMAQSHPAVTNHGTASRARNAATAMALLPFLAAGHTHKEGKYAKVVYRGLEFLMANTNKEYTKGNDVSWFEADGSMYSHGLATMAVCEAYGMTKDKALMAYAQGGMNFIGTAQDPAKGGWRYQPKQPGDTSVVGWQLMALKSGHLSYLTTNPQTIKLVQVYLDSVSDPNDYRAFYGYQNASRSPANTAIGLLCRVHLGWTSEQQGLQAGVEYLSKTRPHRTNLYYNYYASQVLHQWGGDEFQKFNTQLREDLIKWQNTAGSNAGSWHPADWVPGFRGDHTAERGGRLCTTSLATLILEVTYRNGIINRNKPEPFPL